MSSRQAPYLGPAPTVAVAPAPRPSSWTWPALGPGTGQPVVAGPPASVRGPMSPTALYLWITAAWLVLAVVVTLVVVRVLALILLVLGLIFGAHTG